MLSGERMTAEQQGQGQAQAQSQESPSHQAPQSSCGLGSLLSAGCRGRAEAFARRLSRRLQTLGMGGGAAAASADEERPFWRPPPTQPVQVQLARVPSDADVFYDPVDSPVEAAPPPAVAAPLQTCSSDSDSSEVLFFDPESSASNCSSAGEEEALATYNGRASSAGSDSTSTSDTGTLSGLSSSSSSAVHVPLPGLASASDDSRSTRTPSEETRSSPRSQSASDDSRPLSELSALEPTPSSYSTIEDSATAAELSVLEDAVPDRLSGMPEEEESLNAAVQRLGLANGEADEAGRGSGCDCVVRLHSGRCVVHDRLPNGPLPAATAVIHSRTGPECNGDAHTDHQRTFVSVYLQMNCQLDIEADAPLEEGGVSGDDGPRERISDEKSAENLRALRALCQEASNGRPDSHEEAADGERVEDDASQECRIVVSSEQDDEAEVRHEQEQEKEQEEQQEKEQGQEKERAAVNVSGSASNDEDEDSRPQRVRRCSSLKTGKTPPGTPGRKKIVRFADVLGLDLADVRTFLDEIPKIPSSAYDDLRDVDLGPSAPGFAPPPAAGAGAALGGSQQQQQAFAFPANRTLVPLFQQPWTQPDFLDRVRDRQVCLESATLQDPALLSLCGVVRVRNLDFHKSVHVRYTTDGWRTWADAPARYVDGSCDGFSDRFSFVVYADALPAGGRLELAVRFQCRGAQFWDSNAGANYAFQCVAAAAAPALEPLSPVDDRWTSFY